MRLLQVDAYAFIKKKVDAHATPCQLSQHTRAVTVGCTSNGCRASSISALHAPAAQTSAGGTACSLLRMAGCAVTQASPPNRTPIAGLAIPLLTHTCCYSPGMADEPVNPRTPPCWKQLSSLPLLCVVPFLGLVVVHRHGALGASWSTWSTNDIHRPWTVRAK